MTLDARESEMLEKYRPQIEQFGYEVEHFGGKEYMISAIPDNLFNIDMKDLFIEMLDDFPIRQADRLLISSRKGRIHVVQGSSQGQ